METENSKSIWSFLEKNKLYIKCVLIFLMGLVLWIPTQLILEMIRERASRQKEAVADIRTKWAGKQVVTGPLLMVPYHEIITGAAGNKQIGKKFSFFTPDNLVIDATVFPEKRHRGIYEVAVYKTEINLSGKFSPLKWQQLNIPRENIIWNEAVLLFKTEDNIKGINQDLFINWNKRNLLMEPGSNTQSLFPAAFSAPVSPDSSEFEKENQFSMKFSMMGSEQLLFSPVARENKIQMRSAWANPGFTGMILPDSREVSDSGFVAEWKFMNRTIPAVWKHTAFDMTTTAIGTNFLITVDSYDKTERSVKYALLCIILTFASFFLIETVYKKSLHLVQYGLAGLALVLFYTLLLSISEYTGFNPAYLIAGTATISLVAWYVGSIMRSSKLALFISFVLGVVYTYIFIIIQLQDYALLMGSIGLFIALGIIMYFSRRLQWQNEPATALANNTTL